MPRPYARAARVPVVDHVEQGHQREDRLRVRRLRRLRVSRRRSRRSRHGHVRGARPHDGHRPRPVGRAEVFFRERVGKRAAQLGEQRVAFGDPSAQHRVPEPDQVRALQLRELFGRPEQRRADVLGQHGDVRPPMRAIPDHVQLVEQVERQHGVDAHLRAVPRELGQRGRQRGRPPRGRRGQALQQRERHQRLAFLHARGGHQPATATEHGTHAHGPHERLVVGVGAGVRRAQRFTHPPLERAIALVRFADGAQASARNRGHASRARSRPALGVDRAVAGAGVGEDARERALEHRASLLGGHARGVHLQRRHREGRQRGEEQEERDAGSASRDAAAA